MTDNLPPVGEAGPDRNGRRDEPGPVPHTQVHSLLRRTLETLQDVLAILLMLLLLVLSLQALWRLARLAAVGSIATAELLSEIVFVLIFMELYRLMIYYLREHRISVALTVEVALVSILRELMLKGAYEFEIAPARGAQPVAGRPRGAPGHGALYRALAERDVRN